MCVSVLSVVPCSDRSMIVHQKVLWRMRCARKDPEKNDEMKRLDGEKFRPFFLLHAFIIDPYHQ